MKKLCVALCLLGLAVPAMGQFVGSDRIQTSNLTPTRGDYPGVWAFEDRATTPGDTIRFPTVFARGARRIVWQIMVSESAAAPCSLANVFVSNSATPNSSVAAVNGNTVGWTINDYVSGARIGGMHFNGAVIDQASPGGRIVEAVCGGGALRSAWDGATLVLTRKSGLVGEMDSIRCRVLVQYD